MAAVWLFLLLNDVAFCVYFTIYLSILLLMEICILFSLAYYMNRAAMNFLYVWTHEDHIHMYFCCTVTDTLRFHRHDQSLPKQLSPVIGLPKECKSFRCSGSHQHSMCLSLLNISIHKIFKKTLSHETFYLQKILFSASNCLYHRCWFLRTWS